MSQTVRLGSCQTGDQVIRSEGAVCHIYRASRPEIFILLATSFPGCWVDHQGLMLEGLRVDDVHMHGMSAHKNVDGGDGGLEPNGKIVGDICSTNLMGLG